MQIPFGNDKQSRAGHFRLGAVHEKLGEKTMNVHVGAKANAKAEFGFAIQ